MEEVWPTHSPSDNEIVVDASTETDEDVCKEPSETSFLEITVKWPADHTDLDDVADTTCETDEDK